MVQQRAINYLKESNMKVTKRDREFKVEVISNGFLFKFSGRDNKDDWVEDTIYVSDLDALDTQIVNWLDIEEYV